MIAPVFMAATFEETERHASLFPHEEKNHLQHLP
jgi:hypothetical protein